MRLQPLYANADEVRCARDKLVESIGPWGHAYPIGHGVFTIDEEPHVNWRVDAFLRIVSDFGKEVSECRVLDLACLDGLFSVEFAKHGARVVGVDIRGTNIARSTFGADANGVKIDFRVADITKLNEQDYGQFDVILCPGVFYHLDGDQCFELMKIMRRLCPNGVIILETHIGLDDIVLPSYPLSEIKTIIINNEEYKGRFYQEHTPGLAIEKRIDAVSSSLHNDVAFWFLRSSLYKLAYATGYAAVYESLADPKTPISRLGRTIFVLK